MSRITRVQNSLALPRVVDVRPRQLIIHGDITIDEGEGIASQLTDAGDDIKWCKGDLVAYGEAHWGEDMSQIIPERETENWMRYARVSALYPPEERIHDVAWSIYNALRRREDRHDWLDRAEAGQWTVKVLNLELAGDNVVERVTPTQRYDRLADYVRRVIPMLPDGEAKRLLQEGLEE